MSVNPQLTNGSTMVFARNSGGGGTSPGNEVRMFRGWQGGYPVFETPRGTWEVERNVQANVISVVSTVSATPIAEPFNVQ